MMDHILQLVKFSTPLYTWDMKKVPFSNGASPYGHTREYPQGHGPPQWLIDIWLEYLTIQLVYSEHLIF